MTALEQSLWLKSLGHQVLNIVKHNSPLRSRLKDAGQRVLEAGSLWDSFKVRRQVTRFGPDLIVHQQLRDLTYHRLYFPSGTPTVGFLHMFLQVRKRDPWHRFHYKALRRLIVLTEAQKQNALHHLPLKAEQIEIIPNGVSTDRFHPALKDPEFKRRLGIPPDAFVIGVVGRFDPQKGQMETLEAVKELHTKHPRLHLLFVGEDTRNSPGTKSKMLNYIAENSLQKVVQVLPFQEDIPKVMASLDLFLMPSYGETFGRVLIEAMASVVPVVSTRAGGVVSIVDEGVDGILVEPRSASALAEALDDVLKGKKDLAAMSERALEKVSSKFELKTVENQVLSLYQKMAATGRAQPI